MYYDTDITRIKVGAAEAGPFAIISEISGGTNTRGVEGTARRYVFNSAAARVKAGRKTSSYTFDGLLDMTDTDGQNVLEDAYANGTDVWVQFLPDSTAGVGIKQGWAEKCKVTGYEATSEKEGDFVGVSFTLEGDGVQTDVVGV